MDGRDKPDRAGRLYPGTVGPTGSTQRNEPFRPSPSGGGKY